MRTRYLVGLIGTNIRHSLSPALHEDAFARAGLAGFYHLMDRELPGGAGLDRIVDAVRHVGFAGVNVTHPFKETVLRLLDEIAPDAIEIGAVNTVVIGPDGRTRGHNTDRVGFLRAFEAELGRPAIEGRAALLVGAGGAGRAVAHALVDLGVSTLRIHDSHQARAEALARSLRATRGCRAEAAPDVMIAAQDVVGAVNATPLGMTGYPGQALPSECLRPELWVADIVYTPLETVLIAAARRRGCRVMGGGGMCVHQAAAAFRLFTGNDPDVAHMRTLFDRLCAERDARLAADQ